MENAKNWMLFSPQYYSIAYMCHDHHILNTYVLVHSVQNNSVPKMWSKSNNPWCAIFLKSSCGVFLTKPQSGKLQMPQCTFLDRFFRSVVQGLTVISLGSPEPCVLEKKNLLQ